MRFARTCSSHSLKRRTYNYFGFSCAVFLLHHTLPSPFAMHACAHTHVRTRGHHAHYPNTRRAPRARVHETHAPRTHNSTPDSGASGDDAVGARSAAADYGLAECGLDQTHSLACCASSCVLGGEASHVSLMSTPPPAHAHAHPHPHLHATRARVYVCARARVYVCACADNCFNTVG